MNSNIDDSKKKFLEELGKRLHIFIEEKGWKKKEFAEIVGIYPSDVNKYLQGKFDPLNLLEKLIENGIDKNWFLLGVTDLVVKEPDSEYKPSQSMVLQMMDEMKNLMEQNRLLQKEVEELKDKNAKLSVLADKIKITGTSTTVSR